MYVRMYVYICIYICIYMYIHICSTSLHRTRLGEERMGV